jgi:hypothetical protein
MQVLIDLWKKRTLAFMKKGMDRNEALFNLFEKCILLKTVCKSTKVILDFDLIMSDIAHLVASE